jgi:hypothetical protein
MEKNEPKYKSAKNRSEALKDFSCEVCEFFERGLCQGAVLAEGEEPKKKNDSGKTKFSSILGLTPEADAEIRRILQELSRVPARTPAPTIAPQLVTAYGQEIQAARKQKHGWQKIAKIFRAHGLRIGEKTLKTSIEQ